MSTPPPSVPADASPEPPPPPVHHLLVQAPVPAVDADGIRVVTAGTVLFALASVVLVVLRPALAAAGHGWWLPVCLSGAGLGLVGLLYCWNRVHRRG